MGIVVEKAKGTGSNTERKIAKKGPRPAIITGIVDLGVQPQSYEGVENKPCREFVPILTLVSDKNSDEEGNEYNIVTAPWPITIKLSPKANYIKFCKAVDPNGEVVPDGIGDIEQLIGRKVFAVMKHTKPNEEGVVYANCAGIQELPEDYPVPDVEYESVVFDTQNPDKAVFDKLWERHQKRIKGGVNYIGSNLEAVCEGGTEPNTPAPSSNQQDSRDDFDDDIPF